MEHDQIQSYGYEYPNSSSTAPSSSEQFPNKSNREGTRVIYEASNKEGRSNFIPRNNPSTISSSSSQVDQPLSDNNAYAYKNGDPRTSTEIPQDHAISYAQQQEYHENQAPQDQTHYPQQQQHDQEPPRSHIHDPEYNDPVSTSGLGSRFVEPDRLDRDIPPQPQQHYEHDHQSRHNNNQEYDRILTDRDIMESLPEGVQLPPSVDSDLLGERLLNMLLQLPTEQINEALAEYDDAVRVKRNIRNHQAYLHGVLKRYLSVLEKSRESGTKPMGSEITDKVMLRMKDLVDDHFCTNEELLHNERILSKIKMLPEHEALSAIEELAGSNRALIRNFGSYFMGILNRYMRGEKLMQRPTTRRGYGHRDYRARRSPDDDLYDDERDQPRRIYRRDRSWSPDRNGRPPSRRGRRFYKEEEEFYDIRDRSRSRDRFDYDSRFERHRGNFQRRVRNYSPAFQRISHQEQPLNSSATADNFDPPSEHSSLQQPPPSNREIDPAMENNPSNISQHLNGISNPPLHLNKNHQNGDPSNLSLPVEPTVEAPGSSNRLNTSLPTSRWVPPSEIQESSPPHVHSEERGSHTNSRRPPPLYDSRPVDPAEFDIPDTVQIALKNLTELGIVKGNLGYSIHRMISELPEEVALDALDAFGSSDMGRIRNREGYLVGILKKHAHKIGVTFTR